MTSEHTAEANELVHVSHHMFYLVDGEHQPVPSSSPPNGLILVQHSAAVIFTGIHSGVVNLALAIRHAPPKLDTAAWDEVLEVSLHAATGQLRVEALMVASPDLPLLTPTGPGDYRLRVHARGRDTDPDGVAFEPVEDYLITIWPGPDAPEHIHKQTDAYGAGLRQAAAEAPPPAPAAPKPETAEERRRQSARDRLLRTRELRKGRG